MKPSSVLLGVLGILWVLAIAVGLVAVVQYQFSPGASAVAPQHWPSQTMMKLSSEKPTLVMIAHPQCPCTNASITELSRLMTSHSSQVKAYVLFIRPKSLPKGWEQQNALHQCAEKIPGVTVLDDLDGVEAKHFEALTSGQTFVYSQQGQLLYAGGITASRGQIGESPTYHSLVSVIESQPAQAKTALVFGCPLNSPVQK